MKIYVEDPVVPYKTTRIKAIQTQSEINGLLARWGITKYGWEWDIPNEKVLLHFQFTENIRGKEIAPMVTMMPPHIWTKGSRKHREEINWDISLRVLHWYMKSILEMVYLSESDKTTAFLPFIVDNQGRSLREALLPILGNLEKLNELKALENLEPLAREMQPE